MIWCSSPARSLVSDLSDSNQSVFFFFFFFECEQLRSIELEFLLNNKLDQQQQKKKDKTAQ